MIPGELAARADVIAALDPLLPEAHACLVAEGSPEPAAGSVVSIILFTAPDGATQNVTLGWRASDDEITATSGHERGETAGCLMGVLGRARFPASESGLEVDFDLP